MNADRTLSRALLLLIFGGIGLAGVYALLLRPPRPLDDTPTSYNATGQDAEEEVKFAPTDDLEEGDIRLIDSAKSTIDIAMYAFTDERIAEELSKLARRGVHIRMYRDGLQFANEVGNADRRKTVALSVRLAKEAGIEVRVKEGSKSMHLKSFCVDQKVLRTGSANWSESGERSQDNDQYVTRNPGAAKNFEADFENLWSRADNRKE